jgi:group II intron reverse transcriptase/maturase
MRQEQRKAQFVVESGETPLRPRTESGEETYTDLIANRSREHPNEPFRNLMGFFSVENLRQAYHGIEGSKAVGQDHISKKIYGERLEENLHTLHEKIRKMAYRPSPARLVLIPKPDGRKRPIAISNFEDKLVQKVAADILTAIYDHGFHRFSFGFRPKRSCHGAIGFLFNRLRRYVLPYVVDVDLRNFFNTIDQGKLVEILKERIADRRFQRLIVRMLKAGILVEGNCEEMGQGTPQGSIASPILANIFLHRVLDEWFAKTIRPEMGGVMVRYADDVITAFSSKEKAEEFVKRLEGRLSEFSLSLNQEKTRIVLFDRHHPKRETFDFLGFTFYWGFEGVGYRIVLKVKTSMKTLKKKIQEYIHWIKENRSRLKQNLLWEKTAAKLQGHYNYFGVLWNRSKLYHFYSQVIWNLFRWLNRRSQKLSYTWEGFKMLLGTKPLPQPMASRDLLNLADPRLYGV